MAITTKDVTKIAKLSRIAITDEEKETMTKELSSILTMVEELSKVDTSGTAGVASVLEQALPWRSDEITDGNRPKEILANAPESNYSCFVVPKVIDQG